MSVPLSRYDEILKGKALPRYLQAKAIPASFSKKTGERGLWDRHESCAKLSLQDEKIESPSGRSKSYLDFKVELAFRMLGECRFCENDCGTDRANGQFGKCKVGPEPRIASQFLHHGEERPLVPSYTVFFAGCNLRCVYCQNYDISTDAECGRYIEPYTMARRIETLTDVGRAGFHVTLINEWPVKAKNVNWVGGEPTPALHYVLQVLQECHANVPQIWNSNMYMSEQSMRLLAGVVDVYLADLKYGNDECAKRLSGVDRYLEVVTRNHILASEQAELIVRHLMLPGHLECCTLPVLEWLAHNTPNAAVNIMDQYRPMHLAFQYPELRTGIKKSDLEAAREQAMDRGLSLI